MLAVNGIRVIAAVLVSCAASSAIADPPIPPDAMLPNIKVFPPRNDPGGFPDHKIDIEKSFQIGESVQLVFSTESYNVGDGALEIWGGEPNGAGKQKVYQRIYLSGGGFHDRLAGDFVFHDTHDHVHFDDFALYTLQPINAPGASQRQGNKTSFCLIDSNALPGTDPNSDVYTDCDTGTQGISNGWSDLYGYWLADQDIQITGLPAGTYLLKLEIDPENRLVESNENDNVASVTLDIDLECDSDPFDGCVSIVSVDSDGDGINDESDNCIYYANGPTIPDAGSNVQLDADLDNYGNGCDADLNNDGLVNSLDLGLFKNVFLTSDAAADLNGDGIVNSLDIGRFKQLFLQPPGPSGTAP